MLSLPGTPEGRGNRTRTATVSRLSMWRLLLLLWLLPVDWGTAVGGALGANSVHGKGPRRGLRPSHHGPSFHKGLSNRHHQRSHHTTISTANYETVGEWEPLPSMGVCRHMNAGQTQEIFHADPSREHVPRGQSSFSGFSFCNQANSKVCEICCYRSWGVGKKERCFLAKVKRVNDIILSVQLFRYISRLRRAEMQQVSHIFVQCLSSSEL